MFMVSPRTARKWADRYRAEGPAGMVDRSSRPRSQPEPRPPAQVVRQIVRLRWRHRLGPVQIGGRLGIPASTVHAVLVRCRINRLCHIDRVTGEPIRRYEHPHPGSLIHVDVTKFGNIPDGGGLALRRPPAGQRATVRDRAPHRRTRQRTTGRAIGTAFLHTVIDDHSRVAYVEICADEKADTAIGVLAARRRLVRRPRRHRRTGALRQRLCYRSHAWRDACAELGITHEAHPALPAPDQRQDRDASTAPSPTAGPTPATTTQKPNAEQPCPAGSTSTITTGPTPPSAAPPISRLNNLPGHHS